MTLSSEGNPITTFTYNGDGLRRQTVASAATTKFIWDGQDVLLETDVSNNTQVTYIQTPTGYGDLVSQRRSTTTKYYHFDALGSTSICAMPSLNCDGAILALPSGFDGF